MSGAAGLAHAGAGFQERDFAVGQAAVMDEILAQGTARPPAAEKRFVAVEPLLADLAVPGFNPQQHRLPFPAAISDTHTVEYSEAFAGKTRSPSLSAQAWWTLSSRPLLMASRTGNHNNVLA